MSPAAISILKTIKSDKECVFSFSATAVSQRFARTCDLAGIKDLRLHDLRHEAISRFFELGLNQMEVATISGHQTVAMLQRYTHIKPNHLADKLLELCA